MKIKHITLNAVLAVVAAACFLGAFWSAAICRKQAESISNGVLIQMMDRIQEQETLANALTEARRGDLAAVTNLLTTRLCANADAIRSFVGALNEESEPLARDWAQLAAKTSTSQSSQH